MFVPIVGPKCPICQSNLAWVADPNNHFGGEYACKACEEADNIDNSADISVRIPCDCSIQDLMTKGCKNENHY